jgi:hypothetical protein
MLWDTCHLDSWHLLVWPEIPLVGLVSPMDVVKSVVVQTGLSIDEGKTALATALL